MEANAQIKFTNNSQSPSPALTNELTKECVGLAASKWHMQQMKDVCPFIKEWNAIMLFLRTTVHTKGDNEEPKILKQIEHIQLGKLIGMELNGNNIQSIECMSRILQYFWIGESVAIQTTTASPPSSQSQLASIEADADT